MFFLNLDNEPTFMSNGVYALDDNDKEQLVKYKDIKTIEPIVGSSVFTESA
jgi:hypothetical protein